MPSEKSAKRPANDPLALLAQLAGDLYETMEVYCLTRLEQARKSLHKTEKRRTQTQLNLLESQQRLENAVAEDKAKAQDKARKKIEALGLELDNLTQRQELNQREFQALQEEVQATLALTRHILDQARTPQKHPAATKTTSEKPAEPAKATRKASPRPRAAKQPETPEAPATT